VVDEQQDCKDGLLKGKKLKSIKNGRRCAHL